MTTITSSKHGEGRMVQRTNYSRSQISDQLLKVWHTGKTPEDYKDNKNMYKYLVNTMHNGGEDRALRVKGNNVYIFNKLGTVLITTFEVPAKVIRAAHRVR